MEQNNFDANAYIPIPHDVVPLPSKGIFYQSKKKSVKVGYLTAADENFLLGSERLKDAFMITLIRNKLFEKDIKPEDLLQGDIQAILIFLRNTSFGSDYKFNLTDPKTGKNFEGTVSLDELDIRQPKEKPDENGRFTITLPKSGSVAKIRPLTFGEMLELDKREESYPTGMIAPKQTWKLSLMIDELDGNTDKGFIESKINTMPIMDSKYIRNFMNENEPFLDLRKKVIAPSGEEVYVNINFGVEFFRPFF